MKTIVLVLLFALYVGSSFAQSDVKNIKEIPIELKIGNHAFDFPFPFGKIVQKPCSPNIYLGMEFKVKKKMRLYHQVGINFFHHKETESAISLLYNIKHRFNTKFGLFGELIVGGGYNHLFINKPIYQLNSNEDYNRKTNFGKPGFNISSGWNIGYTIKNTNLSFFIGQSWLITMPHYINPIIPNSFTQLGVKFPLVFTK